MLHVTPRSPALPLSGLTISPQKVSKGMKGGDGKWGMDQGQGKGNAGDHRSERPLPTPAPLLTLAASSEEKGTATQEHRGHLNTMSSALGCFCDGRFPTSPSTAGGLWRTGFSSCGP